MIEPRGMSRKQAAAYAGCESLSAFNNWVRRGIMPKSIPTVAKDHGKIAAAQCLRSPRLPDTPWPRCSRYSMHTILVGVLNLRSQQSRS